MAKRRKTKKVTHRRRRRIGGIGGGHVQELLMQIAGGIGASFITKAVEKNLPDSIGDDKMKKIIADASPLVIGFLIPKKSAMIKNIAMGMQIVGGAKLVSGVAGIGAVSYNVDYSVPAVGYNNNALDYRSSVTPMVGRLNGVMAEEF